MSYINQSDFVNKKQLLEIWNVKQHRKFEKIIGIETLEKVLGWRKGYQSFTPNQVRDLINVVGVQLERWELRKLNK